jgi:predicted transcriptional regulator
MTCYLCCRKFGVIMETVNFMAKRFKTVGLVNDPFVGKLYHFAINHGSGLRLNKKANYLANQVKICNCATGV